MDHKTRSLLDEALSWLPGCELTRVEEWLEGKCWRFWFGEGFIMTGGRWRILENSKLLIGSDDHGRKTTHLSEPIDARDLAERSLLTKKAERYTVADGTLDLSVGFEGYTRLELINFDTLPEIWEITGPRNEKVIALSDGELAIWLAEST